ncbi:MAG TPA: hypothetical protein VHA80_01630, partial [Solirubrobacterales bacterium]|nr:hypothetical protein [Solirubrobacterales bacterium]
MTRIHRKTTIVLLIGILAALAASPALAQAAPFGIESVSGSLDGPTGEPLLTAGAHPDLDVAITFKKSETASGGEMPNGNPKDVEVMLPPGLVGNPTATGKCTQGEIYELKFTANCEPDTQVGVATVTSYIGGFPSPNRLPVYNMVPPKGVAGQFAFNLLSDVVFINSEVTANGEYRLRSNIGNISQTLPLGDTELTLWGVPGAASHDAERWPRGGFAPGEPLPFSGPKVPLMTNPTSCTGAPLHFDVRADSWQAPGAFSELGFETDPDGTPLTIEDCPASPFEASFEAQPTTGRADSP